MENIKYCLGLFLPGTCCLQIGCSKKMSVVIEIQGTHLQPYIFILFVVSNIRVFSRKQIKKEKFLLIPTKMTTSLSLEEKKI